ncbi:hypothetical protein [Nitratireductor luteus]|uniref:hypothetical protein n=1 Tax=Nitratireductor luteus TaxID=2976980 RepID=UPI00223FF597|nr:hypothetical protein [Nitratireductor luteus]
MRNLFVVTVALGALVSAGELHAQTGQRFQLERAEDGYVRMDTQTGAISICKDRSGQIVCTLAADERAAYENDLDALRGRVASLEARVEALERGSAGRESSDLPSEEEFEQTLSLMERFFRRFMDIVKGLEEENQTGDRPPEPGKT